MKRQYIRKSLGDSVKLQPEIEPIAPGFERSTNKHFNDYMDAELVRMVESSKR